MSGGASTPCTLCEAPDARRRVLTSCCDTAACRMCAVGYLARTRRCWAVDCGCPCTVADLDQVDSGSKGDLTSRLLTCELCDQLCKRAVTSPCCAARACRACGVKFVTQTRSCWGKGPPNCSVKPGDLRTTDLVNDQELRSAVDQFSQQGKLNPDLIETLVRKLPDQEVKVDMDLDTGENDPPENGHSQSKAENISDDVGNSLSKLNVSPMPEEILNKEDIENNGKVDDSPCDQSEVISSNGAEEDSGDVKLLPNQDTKSANKREVEDVAEVKPALEPLSKRSKFDQVCYTIGPTNLHSQFPNILLVKLSLEQACQAVKLMFSKDFLRFLRDNKCILSEKCINQKSRVHMHKGQFYAFIQVSFKHVLCTNFPLKENFHIANYSKISDKSMTELRRLRVNICSISPVTIDKEPKMCKVFLTFTENTQPSQQEIMDTVFIVKKSCLDNIEIVTLMFTEYAGFRSAKPSKTTAQLIVKAKDGRTANLRQSQVIGHAVSIQQDADIPAILSTSGVEAMEEDVLEEEEDDDVEIVDGKSYSKKEDNWFASVDIETRKKLAERRKTEGNNLFSQRRYKHALKKYSDAIQLHDADATYFSNRSACHISLGDPKSGLGDAMTAVSKEPKFTKGWLRAVRCHILLGDIEISKKICNTIITSSPHLSPLVEEEIAIIAKAEKENNEFINANSKGHFQIALHHMEQLAELCPNCDKNNLAMAELLAIRGQFDACSKLLSGCFGETNNRADVQYVKGLALYHQDDFEEADKIFTNILKLEPTHQKTIDAQTRATEIHKTKEEGNTCFNAGNFEEAHKLYTKALEVDKNNTITNAKLYFNRATVSGKLGKLSDAVDDCTSAIQLDRQYQKAYLRRAQTYLEQELFDQAVKDFEQLVKLDKSNMEYKKLLGEANIQLKSSLNPDFYKLLGVKKTASQDEIKKAYRKAALTHHPDRHSLADEQQKNFHEKKFKEIGEAYGVLSDEVKRRLYDQGNLYQSIQLARNGSYQGAAAMAAAQSQAAAAAAVLLQQAQAQAYLNALNSAAAAARGSGVRLQGAGLAGVRPGFVFVTPGGGLGGLPPGGGGPSLLGMPAGGLYGIPAYRLPGNNQGQGGNVRFPGFGQFRF